MEKSRGRTLLSQSESISRTSVGQGAIAAPEHARLSANQTKVKQEVTQWDRDTYS